MVNSSFPYYLSVVVPILLTAGCGLRGPSAFEQARTQYRADLAECRRRHGHERKVLQGVQCANAAEMRLSGHGPYADLTQVFVSQRLLLAQQHDAGRLTRAEFVAKQALLGSEIQARRLARLDRARTANAAVQAANAASTQAWNSGRPYSCTRHGDTVSCY